MVFSFLFNKESIVGIDIGSSTIKAVEIESVAGGWELINAAVGPAPKDAVKDGIIIGVADVAEAVRSLLRDSGIKATGAVCAISGSQVIVRQVQFPAMSEAVLRKSIRFEASKYISASMDDSVVEFQIMGDGPEPGQMSVMLVAAPKEMVDTRVSVIETAGLEPLVIDIEAFALIRSLIEFHASDEYLHRTVALIDMGASHTDVNIVNRGEFALTRNIPIAGNSFTNAIKSLTGGSMEEAERMKLELTSEHPMDQLSMAEPDNKCWRVVQPLMEELIREVRRSIHYYQSQFPEGSTDSFVSKIILTGGSARMPGIGAYMSSKLNIPTETADIFKRTAIRTDKIPQQFAADHGPVLAVGTGLALKELISEAHVRAAA